MLYNNETFKKYCEDNKVNLLDNYEEIKINRELRIKGLCITQDCNNEFNKSFRKLVKIGGYCYECAVENGKHNYIFTYYIYGNKL